MHVWAQSVFYIIRCLNGKCLGSSLGQQCHSTRDCDIDLFCNFDGYCTTSIATGLPCSYDEQCGRQSACWYNTANLTGSCQKYFSITDGKAISSYMGSTLCKLNEQSYKHMQTGYAKMVLLRQLIHVVQALNRYIKESLA